MIEADRAPARMTVTSVMLDDDGGLRSGYLLVLAEAAAQALLAGAAVHRHVVDVVALPRGAGTVLVAESVLLGRADRGAVCDTTVRTESTPPSVVAVVRHHLTTG